jgi:hypothetical protein
MCISPIFYATRREALAAAKENVEAFAQRCVTRLIEIERELATPETPAESEFFYDASGIFS